ncbi:MAG: zinc ribbon domain-containing protein [Firmicutes bacterium]|nr:zinc ribbon domain-containing protein [Bacillota bacterium]
MDQIKCPKCGAAIPAGSKFCMECGEKIAPARPEKEQSHRTRPMHFAYGNNQSCGGRADVVVRNGFVYYILRKENLAEIRVSPLSEPDKVQTLYRIQGPGSLLSCLNMVEDELVFYEHTDSDRIAALNVYTGERRVISAGYEVSALWIENGVLSFIENGFLMSVKMDGSGHYEYDLPFQLKDRIIGYGGNIYGFDKDTGEVVEILFHSEEYREMGCVPGEDMIYAIIGNLYYQTEDEYVGNAVCCKRISDLEVTNGVQDADRLLTAFEQYVIFNRREEKDKTFAWNIQTLRVYALNRYFELAPWSFTQVLSDYLLIEQNGKLYKIPAPIFFQGNEPMFDDKYAFAEL